MIIDTHAHYDDRAFDGEREELLGELAAHGIGRIVNSGSSLGACRRTIELMERYPFVYGSLGIHPCSAADLTEADMDWLAEQSHREKCVAIGEIGLDYYWDEPAKECQKRWFARQLWLAQEVELPVVIHSREAARDTVDLMRAEHAERSGGVIHCYSYGRELARDFLDMGFYFGIGGVVTFKNGRKLKEVVEYLPMDRILLETDSPYLSPDPNRGKRNDSRNLVYVAAQIAQIKGIPQEEVERVTSQNALRLYPALRGLHSQ
ncbi:MAG: TatD family hydrolase [bacterium]|nr:TatD family hydrolase [bacterium]MCM1374741.1 TatD family hydrolase [Muribaculum sp.]